MPYYPPASSGTAATTVTDESATPNIASAVGVSTNYARQDHTHGTMAFAEAIQVMTADVTLAAGVAGMAFSFVEIPAGNILELAANSVLEVLP